MYLERLEIQGFKSFANRNKLVFSGMLNEKKRGLTAIVGPNGSGKSNVADAIRWALGEQSLKTLRGKKSEDVIFSGSDKKGQLGMAEVSLCLNNSEAAKNKLAVPEKIEKEDDLNQLILSCPEIIITRRVYRSGEGEYLLNGNRVRLSDIQMLLAKANFGQKTYSIIGQGMVENFLNSSATERKEFFDEATGVKQFQIKRDSALNKLESSYENLQQVEMLLTEIRPRLKSLTRQVEKLKKRDEIIVSLKESQLNYYGFLWQDINRKLNKTNGSFLELEKNKIEQEKKLSRLREDLNKIRTTDNFAEANELQAELRTFEGQKNQLQKQFAKLQAELELQLESRGQFDVSWLNNKEGELKNELENLENELDNLKNNKTLQNLEERLLTSLSSVNSEIKKINEERFLFEKLEIEKNSFHKQIAKLEAVLEANLEVQGQFDVSWLNNKNEELKNEEIKIKEEIYRTEQEKTSSEEEKQLAEINAIKEKIAVLNKKLGNLNAELKSLPQNDNQNEAIGHLIDDFLLQLEKIEKEENLGKLKSLLSEAKTDFKKKSKYLISGLDDNKLKQIQEIQTEIISLNEEGQNKQEKLASEKLRISGLTERLRLLKEKEEQINKERGDVKSKLEKTQIKFDAGEIEREKESWYKKISELEKKQALLAKNEDLNSFFNKRQEINDALNDCRLKISSATEKQRLLENKKAQLDQETREIKAKITKSNLKFDAGGLEQEKAAISNKIVLIEEKIGIIEKKLEEINTAQEQEKNQMFACQQSIQSAQENLSSLLEELNKLKIEAARQETRLEDLENNIHNDELTIGEIKNYQVRINEEDLSYLQKTIANNKAQLEQIGGIDPETENEFAETKKRYDFLSAQTEDLDKTIVSLEEIICTLDENIKTRFDQEFKVISEKFNDYFKILFNGGSAKIHKIMLEDLEKEEKQNQTNGKNGESDIALKDDGNEKIKRIKFLKKYNAVGLAGIEIQAVPPGKKIQIVSMLSGGERALTAIALICAIISANPSPFVVLDEADAALDEANSERLAKILDDLSDKTQFIVITHNRASMRRASILYGVTMEENGVSKFLSVKLDDFVKNEN